MKRILQAIDGVATKPVAGANDMAKFLRVVKEANVEYLPPDPEVSAQLRAQSQASMDADGPKHQANTFIRFSSGMYDQSKLPKTMTIKPGVTLPIKFNPIKNMDGDVLANAIAANKLLPPDLQYSSAELSQVVGQNAIQETPEVLPAQQPAPVQENSLNKFLSIVKQNDVSILNEGANPHKVSLPVQMAMQHYQKEECKPAVQQARVGRESVVRKYFDEAEQSTQAEQHKKKQFYKQYGQQIAERVLMKESAGQQAAIAIAKQKSGKYNKNGKRIKENEIPGHSMGFKPGPGGPGIQSAVAETPLDFDKENPAASTIHSHQGVNPASVEARIMRARGQLRELAQKAESNELPVWESIARHFPELAMNIEQIRHGIEELAKIRKMGGRRTGNIPKEIGEELSIKEANAKKRTLKNSNPCWKGYHPVGTKKKGGRTVPNCVPKE